jgi:hypothetical protein
MSLKSMFLDDDKTVNPAYVIAFALVAASICWVSYLVIKNHTMPDLTGIAYLLGGSGAMNLAHKMEDIVGRFKKQDAPKDSDEK